MRILDLNLEDEFTTAFTRGGSPIVECDCGREHVCVESYAFQDHDGMEMVEAYKQRAKTDNKVIIDYIYDAISIIEVGGKLFADGCECKGWKPYMDFILQDRTQIKDFLIKVSEKAQNALEQEKVFNILKTNEMDILDEPPFQCYTYNMKKIYAPWTDEQLDFLIAWQSEGIMHPYTCECGKDLIPTDNGWVCEGCNYRQNWALFNDEEYRK